MVRELDPSPRPSERGLGPFLQAAVSRCSEGTSECAHVAELRMLAKSAKFLLDPSCKSASATVAHDAGHRIPGPTQLEEFPWMKEEHQVPICREGAIERGAQEWAWHVPEGQPEEWNPSLGGCRDRDADEVLLDAWRAWEVPVVVAAGEANRILRGVVLVPRAPCQARVDRLESCHAETANLAAGGCLE